MGVDEGGTVKHLGPRRRARQKRRSVLVASFPAAQAIALPTDAEAVGRDWLASVGLPDAKVSGRHALFERAGQGLRLTDVGSSNGTWLNGRRLAPSTPVDVTDGDIIRLGGTLLVYRDGLEGPMNPSSPVGGLIAPYGLRGLTRALEAWERHPPSNVLIRGETGTGKEQTAAAVAATLGRGQKYVPVNVAGVAPGVFESQLFGHVAGAFSGAGAASPGLVAAHDGGAVFFDEIGELAIDLQPKILRLLENREIFPVGSHEPRTVDVLIIGATHRDLDAMVEAGSFRRDLLARFATAEVVLPPLRERREDLWALVQALAPQAGLHLDSDDQVEVEAVERLMLEPWPNNVRGLYAALARVAQLEPVGLGLWAVEEVLGPTPAPARPSSSGELTVAAVQAALAECDGNESATARRLGVSRGKLRRFIDKEIKEA